MARKWEQIVENRLMKTNWYKILDYKFPLLKLELDVGSWTYIRSIWHWLWEQFWLWWILTMLRRTRIWKYKLSEIVLDKEWIFFRKEWDDIKFRYWIII